MKNILFLILCNLFVLTCFSQLKKDGEHREYYENGQLKINYTYKDEKKEEIRVYYENGQLKSILIVKEGKREGELSEYDENGKLIKIRYFKNGEEIIK